MAIRFEVYFTKSHEDDFFYDIDMLNIEFREGDILETRWFDMNTLLDLDENASNRTDVHLLSLSSLYLVG